MDLSDGSRLTVVDLSQSISPAEKRETRRSMDQKSSEESNNSLTIVDSPKIIFQHRRVNSAQRRKDFANSVRQARYQSIIGMEAGGTNSQNSSGSYYQSCGSYCSVTSLDSDLQLQNLSSVKLRSNKSMDLTEVSHLHSHNSSHKSHSDLYDGINKQPLTRTSSRNSVMSLGSQKPRHHRQHHHYHRHHKHKQHHKTHHSNHRSSNSTRSYHIDKRSTSLDIPDTYYHGYYSGSKDSYTSAKSDGILHSRSNSMDYKRKLKRQHYGGSDRHINVHRQHSYRDKDRDRDRDRDRYRDRDKYRDRDRDIEWDRDRDIDKYSDRDRYRDRDRNRHRYRDRDRNRDRNRYRDWDRAGYRDRDRYRDRDYDKDWEYKSDRKHHVSNGHRRLKESKSDTSAEYKSFQYKSKNERSKKPKVPKTRSVDIHEVPFHDQYSRHSSLYRKHKRDTSDKGRSHSDGSDPDTTEPSHPILTRSATEGYYSRSSNTNMDLLSVPRHDSVVFSDQEIVDNNSDLSLTTDLDNLSSSGISADIHKPDRLLDTLSVSHVDTHGPNTHIELTRRSPSGNFANISLEDDKEPTSDSQTEYPTESDRDSISPPDNSIVSQEGAVGPSTNSATLSSSSSTIMQNNILPQTLQTQTKASTEEPVSPNKHPFQDSAYQSKEQSTEKCNSRPSSNAVSPTLSCNTGRPREDSFNLYKHMPRLVYCRHLLVIYEVPL